MHCSLRSRSRLLRALLCGVALVGTPVAAATVSLTPVPAQAAVPKLSKLAVVDMQEVLNKTKAGKAARTKLEKSSKAKQGKFDKKRAELEADAAKLSTLSGPALAEAQQSLQERSLELQNMLMALEQELAEQHNKLLDKMYENSQKIVEELAAEKSIDLVLVRDPMTVIWTTDGLDITDEVVKRYDAKYPK